MTTFSYTSEGKDAIGIAAAGGQQAQGRGIETKSKSLTALRNLTVRPGGAAKVYT
jgi:hypothetical protein